MSYRGILAILIALAAAYTLGAQGQGNKKPVKPPQAEALELVFKTQTKPPFDGKADWWFDTKEHAWVVKRPFGPGIFHSTHWFDVSYRVDGKTIESWLVDTRKGTAERRKS